MAKKDSTPKDYYVYLHRKATTGEIFYVGKGFKNRAYSKLERNRHWNFIAKKHGFIVEIVERGLQEWAAFELESELIALYGRMDLGLGVLVNYTDGGDGSSGVVQSYETRLKKSNSRKGKKHSEETKKKISETNIKTKSCPIRKEKFKNRFSGENSPMFGKKMSAESRLKMSLARIGRIGARRRPIMNVETGKEFNTTAEAAAWIASVTNKSCCKSSIKAYVNDGRPFRGYTFKVIEPTPQMA